ncbi:hypothetical protein Glove_33g28 [Diversispora epigaea]|uniref:Reverse transcriptase zinc-binding domain-containing protein n=1 Tax=Diversispora epigaea TaxID=1348612 RepID=A0A397JTA1_9GLOM|nr:hypothetical protein Glove_33g28 [Diversispora epigaea]
MLKKLNECMWTQKWLKQNRIKWWITQHKAKKVHWKFATKTQKYLLPDFQDAKYRQFSLKLLNSELPTLNNLNKRKPWIYKTNTCPFCAMEVENNIHVFTCQAQTNINPLQ